MPVKIDMEMPKNCWECILTTIIHNLGKGNYYCQLVNKPISIDPDINRPSWCPLQEVK